MKFIGAQNTCAVCNRPLKWWNSQSCIDCGKTICSGHAHAVKRRHSSVLVSYCVGCSGSHSRTTTTRPVTYSQQQEVAK